MNLIVPLSDLLNQKKMLRFAPPPPRQFYLKSDIRRIIDYSQNENFSLGEFYLWIFFARNFPVEIKRLLKGGKYFSFEFFFPNFSAY